MLPAGERPPQRSCEGVTWVPGEKALQAEGPAGADPFRNPTLSCAGLTSTFLVGAPCCLVSRGRLSSLWPQWTGLSYGKVTGSVTQSCPNLCHPMDCSPPGSSVRGILQSRKLDSVAMPFSGRSSPPRDPTWATCIAGRFFTG